MNTQQLQYVLAVAECGSISKAAKKLYVTQPSLSQYIQSIEKQLGIQLFDRKSSPLSLTDAGIVYVKWAKQMLAMEQSLQSALDDLMQLQSGTVRLGASSFRVRCLLAQSIAAFHAAYPKIHMAIHEAEMNQLEQLLSDNQLDFVIGSGNPHGTQFHIEELAAERLYLAVSPYSSLCAALPEPLTAADICQATPNFLRHTPMTLQTVQHEPFIAAASGEYDAEKLKSVCGICGFIPQIAYSVRTIETVFSFVCSNMGIALIPDSLIYYGNFREHPYYYMLPDSLARCGISLISKRDAYRSKAASAYALLLKQLVDIGTWRMMSGTGEV